MASLVYEAHPRSANRAVGWETSRVANKRLCGGGAAAAMSFEVSAYRRNGTQIALGFGTFADLLAVTFEQQVGAGAGVEPGGDAGLDLLLRLFVSGAVILMYPTRTQSNCAAGSLRYGQKLSRKGSGTKVRINMESATRAIHLRRESTPG